MCIGGAETGHSKHKRFANADVMDCNAGLYLWRVLRILSIRVVPAMLTLQSDCLLTLHSNHLRLKWQSSAGGMSTNRRTTWTRKGFNLLSKELQSFVRWKIHSQRWCCVTGCVVKQEVRLVITKARQFHLVPSYVLEVVQSWASSWPPVGPTHDIAGSEPLTVGS